MEKNRTKLYDFVALLLIAVATNNCADSAAPTSPSALVSTRATNALSPDGVISLKTSAPVLLSPVNDAVTGLTPLLTTANSQPRYVASADFVYRFEVYQVQTDGTTVLVEGNTVEQTPNTTSYTVSTDLEQGKTHMWRARAQIGDENGPWSNAATFHTPALPRAAPPAPNPPPGGQLPLPNEAATIIALAALFPAELADSCQEDGGTWDFLDRALATLRLKDGRWGYNCKRGNCGDISLDIIGGHCGPNPSPQWIDQTLATTSNGDIGRWSSTR